MIKDRPNFLKQVFKRIVNRLLAINTSLFIVLFLVAAVAISIVIVLSVDFLWDGRFNLELEFAGILTPFLDGLLLVVFIVAMLDEIRGEIKLRREMEGILRESEERFRGAFENAPIGMALVSLDGRWLRVNSVLPDILGYSADELLSKTFVDITYPPDLDKDLENLKMLLSGEIPYYHTEKRYIHKQGHIIWALLSASLVHGKEGKQLHIVVQIENITKRKQMEETIKQSEANLKQAQQIAHVGSWEQDVMTNKMYWSDEVYRIFGLPPQETEASNELLAQFIHPDDREMVIKAVNESMATGTRFDMEHRIVLRNASVKVVHVQTNMVYDTGNKLIKTIGTIQDITEQKYYEQQLKDINATKDKFFSIIAHDLKNPFNTLLGASQELNDNIGELDKEDIKEMSLMISKNAQNACSLLENLLTWSRSQLGRIEFIPQHIKLNEAVTESIKSVEGQATEKEIGLISKVEDISVYADPNLLKTIIRNLLSNAIKYTQSHGSITVASKQVNGAVEVSVTDTGVGISPETIDKLFRIDAKLSTPGTAKETGTGLGLILCKEFVEKHGGRIWVESEVGKGTTFTFSIPAENI